MVGFFFFQSLYLDPIISQMNKNLYALSHFRHFLPFLMEKRGETPALMLTLVSRHSDPLFSLPLKTRQVQLNL